MNDETIKSFMKEMNGFLHNGNWYLQLSSREIVRDPSDSLQIVEALNRISEKARRYATVGKKRIKQLDELKLGEKV